MFKYTTRASERHNKLIMADTCAAEQHQPAIAEK